MIYFQNFGGRGELVRIGHTNDLHARQRAHDGNGHELLAVMGRSLDFEQRLHVHFRSDAAEVKSTTSVYRGRRVWNYVEALQARVRMLRC